MRILSKNKNCKIFSQTLSKITQSKQIRQVLKEKSKK